jgi:hypothetical protein
MAVWHHGDRTYSLFWMIRTRSYHATRSKPCAAVQRGLSTLQLCLAPIHSICPQPAHIKVSLCPSFSSRPWSSFPTSSLNSLSLPKGIASTRPWPASDRKPRQRIYIQKNTIRAAHMSPCPSVMSVCISPRATFPLSNSPILPTLCSRSATGYSALKLARRYPVVYSRSRSLAEQSRLDCSHSWLIHTFINMEGRGARSCVAWLSSTPVR